MIRVGFRLNEASSGWLGGLNYFRNLLFAVQSLPGARLQPVILTRINGTDTLSNFPELEILETELLTPRKPAFLLRGASRVVSKNDVFLNSYLKKHKVDVLSHAYNKTTSIPTLGWIPDFQHVHLPSLFTEDERQRRNASFLNICERCDRIIVSSESAKADLEAFAPKYVGKAVVLRFVSTPPPASNTSLEELEERYKFKGKFFILPNQFYIHKNHRVVVNALSLLKKSGRRVTVLATGSTVDAQNPNYFQEFSAFLADADVQEEFRILGIIPFHDVVALMRQSVGFINPSRFEGWSTSVEEAKSLGKSLILSSIPVHREQAPERGLFFDCNGPEELAENIWKIWNEYDADSDVRHQAEAAERFPERQRQFARNYEEIIISTISK